MVIKDNKAVKTLGTGDRMEIEDQGDRILIRVFGCVDGVERILFRREFTEKDMVGHKEREEAWQTDQF